VVALYKSIIIIIIIIIILIIIIIIIIITIYADLIACSVTAWKKKNFLCLATPS